MLQDGAWLRHANHANTMAKRLRRALSKLSGIKVLHPTQANAVFVDMPPVLVDAMHKPGWPFYTLYSDNDARLMCSWDTTKEDIDDFVGDLNNLMTSVKNCAPIPVKGRGASRIRLSH